MLTGEGSGAVSLMGDEVVLDVNEAVEELQRRLVTRGLARVDDPHDAGLLAHEGAMDEAT